MGKPISNIVFTKNRPLQLAGYLESLYRYFPAELVQSFILYKPELFENEYQQLFRKYSNCVVIEESDFHSDIMNLIKRIDTKYLLFGIDDVVYFDSVNFDVIDETFNRFSEDIFGFSLRFSREGVKDGRDFINEVAIGGQTVYSLNWKKGRTASTRYPFELCATLYPASLVKRIINSAMNNNPLIKAVLSPNSAFIRALGRFVSMRSVLKSFGFFFSPNTFESWNCRWCQRHSDGLPGRLYFQKLCASAIQVNMVNVTNRKVFDSSADYTIETLAEKYKQGYRLDIESIAQNKPLGAHCGKLHFKLVKN